jgi:hypothetical protein
MRYSIRQKRTGVGRSSFHREHGHSRLGRAGIAAARYRALKRGPEPPARERIDGSGAFRSTNTWQMRRAGFGCDRCEPTGNGSAARARLSAKPPVADRKNEANDPPTEIVMVGSVGIASYGRESRAVCHRMTASSRGSAMRTWVHSAMRSEGSSGCAISRDSCDRSTDSHTDYRVSHPTRASTAQIGGSNYLERIRPPGLEDDLIF